MTALYEVAVGVDVRDGLYGLQEDPVVEVHVEVGAPTHYFIQRVVHHLGGGVVITTEFLHHLQDLDLLPWGWHPMVIEFMWVSMIDYLY